MSNEILNAHISYGSPCGDDAELSIIADWAGSVLLNDNPRKVYLVEEITGMGFGDYDNRIVKVFLTKDKATEFVKKQEMYKDMVLNSKCPIDKPEDQMSDAELDLVYQWENEVSNAQCDDATYRIIEMEVEK